MKSITTVTQKGQVMIFGEFRKKYGIKPRSKLRIVASDGHLRLYPVKDILDMAGSVKPVKNKPVAKAREWMENNYRRV